MSCEKAMNFIVVTVMTCVCVCVCVYNMIAHSLHPATVWDKQLHTVWQETTSEYVNQIQNKCLHARVSICYVKTEFVFFFLQQRARRVCIPLSFSLNRILYTVKRLEERALCHLSLIWIQTQDWERERERLLFRTCSLANFDFHPSVAWPKGII